MLSSGNLISSASYSIFSLCTSEYIYILSGKNMMGMILPPAASLILTSQNIYSKMTISKHTCVSKRTSLPNAFLRGYYYIYNAGIFNIFVF